MLEALTPEVLSGTAVVTAAVIGLLTVTIMVRSLHRHKPAPASDVADLVASAPYDALHNVLKVEGKN